ncbi:hypothetical protein [Maribellus sp. YY47]|uniref:hypothetical protein n=1 Tax=Maribellus sp. YY47 TaxID=2929486 RepID=UPI002000DD56|nr:hypothetical protein [Maribellus sp. YY47]MCK3685092.1 hypothetical protein [Maribellus sp. YY47]
MKLKNRIYTEFTHLFSIQASSRKWQIAALTAVCAGMPLLVGLYLNNIGDGLIACLSGMVILYLLNTGTLTNKISTLSSKEQ